MVDVIHLNLGPDTKLVVKQTCVAGGSAVGEAGLGADKRHLLRDVRQMPGLKLR